MGLDYSISFEIRRKGSHKSLLEIEVAYWRKCWGLAYELNHLAQTEEYRFDKNAYLSDWLFECNTDVIPELINMLCKELPNEDAPHWENSLWGISGARAITAAQLVYLIHLQAFLNSKFVYENDKGQEEYEFDFEELEVLIEHENQSYYRTDENKIVLSDELKNELMTNPNLDFVINFSFSY